MAKFGVDVTQMSAPNLGAAKFVEEGIVNKAPAMQIQTTTQDIKALGEMGMDAFVGYQRADIEREQEKVIQEYMDRRDPAALAAKAEAENTEALSLFSQGKETNAVLKNYNESVSRFSNAYKQGVMSAEEFHTRTLTVLRNAVNKNPGLMKELADQANTVLELSGITGIIKQDVNDAQAKAKLEEDTKTNDMSIAKQFNIPLARNVDGSVDWIEVRRKNAQVQQEQFLIDQADRQTKLTEDQFRNFGTNYATGKINQATDMAIKIINDPTVPYDKALLQMNLVLDSVEQGFSTDPRVSRIIDKPAVQSTHTYIKTQIDAIKKNLTSFASKEDAATYLKNTTAMLRDQQYQDISKTVNPQMLDVLSKLTTNAGTADFISSHPDLKVQLYNGISRIVEGLPSNGDTMYTPGRTGQKAPAINTFNSLLIDAGKLDSESTSTALNNSVSSIDQDTRNLPVDKKFNFYSEYTKSLGGVAGKAGVAKLTDESRQKVNNHVNEYTTLILDDMKSTLAKKKDSGVKIHIDMLPDGRLSLTSTDQATTTDMNKRYINRINDSLAAFANLNRYGSTKEASPKFYQQYKQYFASGQ